MDNTASKLMRDYVNSQKFNSTADIMKAMKDLFRDALQQVMEVELEEQLGYEKSERTAESSEEVLSKNYRNGYSRKSVKTQLGKVEVKIPRDRNGEYEPKIIAKYDRNVAGMEEKVLGLYACGMSQRDIAEQIKSLYDVEISPELVSKISEKIMPEVTAWRNHPLESVYPFVFMDAIHYKVKENHQYITKAAYVVLGIRHGWEEGYFRRLDWRKREQQILVIGTKQPEKPRCTGCLRILHVDETGIDRYLYREYGWSVKGQPLLSRISGRRYQRTGVVAAQLNREIHRATSIRGDNGWESV